MGVPLFKIRQVDGDEDLWEREDGSEQFSLLHAPAGAVWDAEWMGDAFRVNGSGPCLVIRLPNGSEFEPGFSASNCDRKGEEHDCWCVHGEAPNLTIDKNPEPGRSTCSAGGGSIWSGQGTDRDWHGFVTNGELVQV